MRRRISHRARPSVPTPPIVVEAIEPEVVEDVMPFVLTHEDEIINYIKDKATKETLKSLAPLLEKLEEAVKQQQANQAAATTTLPTMNYEEQLKKLQETSREKITEKEFKVAERINKLQMRFANMRK